MMNENLKIEPEYADVYNGWTAAKNPESTTKLLSALQPSIDKAISAHIGTSNPILRSRAKQMSLHAMNTYDPKKARIGTHLMNQLQGLKRVNRQQLQIVSVPERIALEHGYMMEAENELRDRFGRDPTDAELSDHVGVSSKRLKYVRRYHTPMAEGTFTSMAGDDEASSGYVPAVTQQQTTHWAELVYDDTDRVGQLIMEHSLGLHGRPILSNTALANKLGISPGAVSQRKAAIQQRLNEQNDLSPFGA